MNDKIEQLRPYNLWNGNRINCGYERPLYTDRIIRYLGNRLVKVLTGQRRTGKSYILRQIATKLIEQGVNDSNILFINKEFAVFDELKTYEDLNALIRLYLSDLKPQGKFYLFIDEIQDIQGWEKSVNSFAQDYTLDCELFITGSNSQMFSSELSTLLSGRYVEFRIFPLSYEEYICIKGMPNSKSSYLAYTQDGGYPELLNFTDTEIKRNYMSALKDTVLLKDVIRRYAIKDVRLLEDLFAYVTNNAANLLSVSNIANYIKSKGRKSSYDTVSAYIDYIESTFLIHRALRYNIKGKETLAGVCKFYANDLAFKNFLFAGMGYGIGYQVENLVYLELLRQGFDVYVGTIKEKEVDFVAIKNDRRIYLQATYVLADEATIQREYAPLKLIDDNYEKYIVSLDDLPLASQNGIRHIQAWQLSPILKGDQTHF